MQKVKYYIVDVFANNKYQGNQLAVFIDFENLVGDIEMQEIAKELNFAEITFIKDQNANEHYRVRIFTPEHEVPFAGHPSLGTSYIIAKFIMPKPKPTLVLQLAHANIHIKIKEPENVDNSIIDMQQTQPEFREFFTHKEIAEELEISLNDLNTDLPVQEISTGLPYIIIPIQSLKAMENINFKYETIKTFLEKRFKYKTNSSTGHSTSLFFFANQTYEANSHYNTRMILLENNKLSEDAATGSANGCFLAYLLKYVSNPLQATVEQGFQMNRPSHIYLNGTVVNEHYEINVGGKVKLIAAGVWYV